MSKSSRKKIPSKTGANVFSKYIYTRKLLGRK